MPINHDTAATWRYHNATKHSYWSVRNNPHHLDWANQPFAFKLYPSLEPIPLPRETPQTGVAALSAIAQNIRSGTLALPDISRLAQILYFSAGITKHRQYPGGEIYFRAAACTGALYEIELYVVCGDLSGLPAGIYHFSPAEFALRRLRAGDFRGILADATAREEAVAHAPVLIVCSGTYWRNAWKYQARTYRHFGWDNGTLLANMLAMCTALGFPARVMAGFVDAEINRLLDLETHREVAFAVVPVGFDLQEAPLSAGFGALDLPTIPISQKEVDYPAMREMHKASGLTNCEEVRQWRSVQTPEVCPAAGGATIPLQTLSEDQRPSDSMERVILRRGSTRQFARDPISFAQLSTMLDHATCGFPADFHDPAGAVLNEVYLIVNAVDGLQSGAYYFHRDTRELELLKGGAFRDEAAYLGLEQELPRDASADIFFLADLNRILETYGNRGYRAVQLEAGLLGGKFYLTAYAMGLGASGLTFYDDDVINFFSPHANGKSTIFLTALGVSARKKKQ